MKNTTKKLEAALALLALLKKNVVVGVVGEMSEDDRNSLRRLCAECDIPAPQVSSGIAQSIEEVEKLIASLTTQLEAEKVGIEKKIEQSQDVPESNPKLGNRLKVKL